MCHTSEVSCCQLSCHHGDHRPREGGYGIRGREGKGGRGREGGGRGRDQEGKGEGWGGKGEGEGPGREGRGMGREGGGGGGGQRYYNHKQIPVNSSLP